jgi:hypothetical protein
MQKVTTIRHSWKLQQRNVASVFTQLKWKEKRTIMFVEASVDSL